MRWKAALGWVARRLRGLPEGPHVFGLPTVNYHVYKNNDAGGPVDYSTVIATVTVPSYTYVSVFPCDTIIAIRAFDPATGLEEQNVSARCRVRLDASGNNISAVPNAPDGLTVRPGAGGSALAQWAYNAGGQGGAPTGFHVYIGTPTVSFGSPVASAPYSTGRLLFSANLSGLSNATYQVVVRAYNATTEETNTNAVTFTASSIGPLPVEDLTGTAVF